MTGPQGWVNGPNANFAREFDPAANQAIAALRAELDELKQIMVQGVLRDFKAAADAIEPEESLPGRSSRANEILRQARWREGQKADEGKSAAETTFEQFTRARNPDTNLTVGQRYRILRGIGAVNEGFASGDVDHGLERGFQDFTQVISPFIPGAHLAQIASHIFHQFVENRLKEILDARAAEIKASVDKSLAEIEAKFQFLSSKDFTRTRFRNEVSSSADPQELQRQGWNSQEASTMEGV